jgi:uncharacterized protein (DUF736 family)
VATTVVVTEQTSERIAFMQTLGTFLKDGDCLTGIIRTPVVQTRLTFVPDRTDSGSYIAFIGNYQVGYATAKPATGGLACYAVYLHPAILPDVRLAALIEKEGVYILTACR